MGIEELWETVFFSTFFPGCFQPHELLLLQTGALAFPILLSDCSCHRLLPVDPTWQTPWEDKSKLYSTPLRTEVTTIHFSCHRVEAQPVTPSSLGPSGFAGSGGWGQRGWCSHPCRRRLGTCFCRNYQKRWCPHTWPSSACLTSVTQEVVLLFWPSFHHLDSFPTPGQCTVPLPPCERISFLSITNIGLIAYLRKKKTMNCHPPNSVVSHCG